MSHVSEGHELGLVAFVPRFPFGVMGIRLYGFRTVGCPSRPPCRWGTVTKPEGPSKVTDEPGAVGAQATQGPPPRPVSDSSSLAFWGWGPWVSHCVCLHRTTCKGMTAVSDPVRGSCPALWASVLLAVGPPGSSQYCKEARCFRRSGRAGRAGRRQGPGAGGCGGETGRRRGPP